MPRICVALRALHAESERRIYAGDATHGDGVYEIAPASKSRD
jgi:hypothetical protein